MKDDIQQAIKVLKAGGIVIFPTDTAFGIGCRMDDEKAVKRLFSIRKRPESQATSVLISSLNMAEPYLETVPEDVVDKLVKPYWPGGLTIVLQSKIQNVSNLIRGGTTTLGVRVPDHLTTLELISGVGVPLLGPSANFSGEKTPYEFEDLNPELTKLVDYVVPGECHTKLASTVIDCTVTPSNVLRQGSVTIKL